MYLNNFEWSKTKDQMKRKEKKKYKDKLNIKISSSWRRGVNIGVVLSWLGGGIVLYIDIFWALLEEGACSSTTKVEFNGAKVNLRVVFHSVHLEILKAGYVVGVHQVSELLGRLKLCNRISLCFIKKGTQLIIPLLEVIKTSILLYSIGPQLLNQVLQLLGISLALAVISAHLLHSSLTSRILVSSMILVLSISVAYLDAAMNLDIA